MIPGKINSGCKAVDISRTCFEAWKAVPDGSGDLVPMRGRYYFLEPGCAFLQRSQLGGHWWEGQPFQEGDYATLPDPKPRWVNGAYPIGEEWPPNPGCCCGVYQGFTCSRVEFHVHRTVQDDDAMYLANAILQVGFGIQASKAFDIGVNTSCTLTCSPCQHVYQQSVPTMHVPAQVKIEEGIADPLYVVTVYTTEVANVIWPLDLGAWPGTVKVRFFRQP